MNDFFANIAQDFDEPITIFHTIGDLVSKETVCCVGGKVKH